MIKANELRIGNLIKVGDVVAEVTGDLMNYCSKKTEVPEFYPIPLTPEILEKAGLKGEDHGNVTFIHYYIPAVYEFCEVFELGSNRSDLGDYKFGSFYFSLSEFEMEIKYLHQLQNLYFALTGNELEINL